MKPDPAMFVAVLVEGDRCLVAVLVEVVGAEPASGSGH
jgi:hypothetical protein